MAVLALLDDGACTLQNTCLKSPGEVHGQCPQSFKCGTCVAWSPREENAYSRNSGECMLNRDTRVYLDCNAAPCPYYRPRRTTAAFEEWKAKPAASPSSPAKPRRRRVKMDREAPPPSPAALASSAFAEMEESVAELGAAILSAELEALGELPVLLERFRGGSVSLQAEGQPIREAALEAFYARLVLLRKRLSKLRSEVEAADLRADERAKALKDLGGIGGSMTTFNLLFADKADHFRGQGKGG